MIKPKFHLQALKNKKGNLVDSPVLLLFSVNGSRLQYYTSVRVPEKYQVKSGKYPFKNEMPGSAEAKIKIDSLVRHAYSIESDLIKNGLPQTVETFKLELDKRFKGREALKSKTPSIEEYLSEYLLYVKNNLAYNTHRNQQSVINHFREFLGKKVDELYLSDINDNLIDSFKEYLKQDRLNNTVVKSMQILRTFLQYCKKKKYIPSLPLIETGSPNNITVIHLSYDEVMKMAYTPMPSITLERVRDFFVFGSFTGMRHSDISSLKKNNVFKDHIKFFVKKSGTTQALTVPLTPVSKAILDKYKNSPGEMAIPSISNQKTNDRLKEVAELARLNSVVEIACKDASGRVTTVEKPKHELVTCHISRKSFITIAMRLGMPESVIISITGHSKGSKAFHKYYDVVNETKFEQMAKAFNI